MREGLTGWPPEMPVADALDEAGRPIETTMKAEWREHLESAAPLVRLEQGRG